MAISLGRLDFGHGTVSTQTTKRKSNTHPVTILSTLTLSVLCGSLGLHDGIPPSRRDFWIRFVSSLVSR